MAATPSMPDDEVIEQMARRIHAAYQAANAEQGSSHPAMADWEHLDPPLRAQNRDQARHLVVVFHGAGFELVEASGAPDVSPVVPFDDALVERLARDEHDRWARAKEAQGYEWGPERNDGPEGPLTHPDLRAWDELHPDTQAKDRRPLLDFPAVCASVGLELRRR